MEDIKLLPCPCCGGKAKIHKGLYRYFDFIAVICMECGLKTTDQPTIEAAVDKWNTRKPIDRIVERLEEKGHLIHLTDLSKCIKIDEAIEIVKEVSNE